MVINISLVFKYIVYFNLICYSCIPGSGFFRTAVPSGRSRSIHYLPCSVTKPEHITTTVQPGTPTMLCAAGIDENTRPEILNAFPNPVKGIVQWSYFFASVFDAQGKQILCAINTNTVDLSNQGNGICFVVLKNRDEKSPGKAKSFANKI